MTSPLSGVRSNQLSYRPSDGFHWIPSGRVLAYPGTIARASEGQAEFFGLSAGVRVGGQGPPREAVLSTKCHIAGPAVVLFSVCVSASPPVYPDAVTDADDLAPFFEAAATRRVDVVGIGDSNQLRDGHGWDSGLITALDARFGTWATSLLSLGENNGNGGVSGEGWGIFSTTTGGPYAYSGAPTALDAMLATPENFGPLRYLHIPDQSTGLLQNHGLRVSAGGPIDVNERLFVTTIIGVTQSVLPMSFRPSTRRADSPYNTVAQAGTPVLYTGATPTSASVVYEIPPATRDFSLQCMLGGFNTSLAGPFVAYYIRAREADAERGVSFSTLYGVGSQSARDMAQAFVDLPIETLTLYFDTLREQQLDAPKILIRINTGLNDRNEQMPPVNGSVFGPASGLAFQSNLNTLINRIQEVWTLNGWPEDELYFVITVSHPVGPENGEAGGFNNDDPTLIDYRARAAAIASSRPRVASVDLNRITTEAEMAENLWYRSTKFDRFHLREIGYEVLAQRELAAMQQGRSWYDTDENGTVEVEDLYALRGGEVLPVGAPSDVSERGLTSAVRYGEIQDLHGLDRPLPTSRR